MDKPWPFVSGGIWGLLEEAARESRGPAWCLFFSIIECCIIVDLLMGEDNRTFSLFLIAIFHMVQGDPGCMQELREALCGLHALPWCGRHWLCLLNTDHYCLSCNDIVSGWTKITFCGQQLFEVNALSYPSWSVSGLNRKVKAWPCSDSHPMKLGFNPGLFILIHCMLHPMLTLVS